MTREVIPGGWRRRWPLLLSTVVTAATGLILIQAGHAATYTSHREAESGTLAGATSAVNDGSASGGTAVKFGVEGQPSGPVRAFPGAAGFGADTRGGRGGRVIEVTNLNDSGAGSFREAVSASGPRIVVFRVGGIINLTTGLNIFNPYLTIAGQTAPGNGIVVRGYPVTIAADEAIMRGMRFRIGDDLRNAGDNAIDGIRVGNYQKATSNVILDHNSFSWAIDENIDTYYTPSNITISWNITSEALVHLPLSAGGRSESGYGMLIGESVKRISVHHNLFAHNNERNPIMKGGTNSEVINNLIYDWRNYATHATDPENVGSQVGNIINNFYKPGPNTENSQAITIFKGTFYAAGNTGTTAIGSAPVAAQSGMAVQTAQQAYSEVLANAGAMSPQRDSVDNRVVTEVGSGSGKIIASEAEVGGLPAYPLGTAPADTDHDGMPDSWENSRGLNPNNPADAGNVRSSGYTAIEDYINSLLP